jgi:hypothetical protein
MLTTGTDYTDLGPGHHLRPVTNPARRAAQLLAQLHGLAFNATLEPITATRPEGFFGSGRTRSDT